MSFVTQGSSKVLGTILVFYYKVVFVPVKLNCLPAAWTASIHQRDTRIFDVVNNERNAFLLAVELSLLKQE